LAQPTEGVRVVSVIGLDRAADDWLLHAITQEPILQVEIDDKSLLDRDYNLHVKAAERRQTFCSRFQLWRKYTKDRHGRLVAGAL
jgi:hypothetical protein